MSDVKHTPGPWLVREKGDDFEIGTGAWADWGGSDMAFSEFQVATAWGGHENNYANARLIAAAPELLEVLEKWVELIERTRKTQSLFIKIEANSAADFMQGLEETRAAIAKAKGEGEG